MIGEDEAVRCVKEVVRVVENEANVPLEEAQEKIPVILTLKNRTTSLRKQ